MLEIIGFVFLGLLVLYVLVCTFYYFFQERLIFVPWGQMKRDTPIVLGSAFEEVWMDGVEEGEIHAIHIKTRQPRGCVLYFHGNTGSISRWGAIAEELTSFGFDVFLPDYRGYGKSRGVRTEETLYSDALTCYKKVQETFPDDKICIYGRSLGSGIASWLAARTRPAAVILETPYNSMIEVATYHSPVIPVKLFLRFTFRSDIHLRRAESPILIAHGTKDKVVPYKSGLSLYNSIKDQHHTQMLTIPGGKHGNLNGYPVFRKTLERFFDRYFPKSL